MQEQAGCLGSQHVICHDPESVGESCGSQLKIANKQDGSTWVTAATMMLYESTLGPSVSC